VWCPDCGDSIKYECTLENHWEQVFQKKIQSLTDNPTKVQDNE